MIAEEASTSRSSFLTSLESMVRFIQHFNVITAKRLINLMAGTTLQRRSCILKSVDLCITDWEKVEANVLSLL